MGNKQINPRSATNKDSLETYSKLLQMGFDGQICLEASNKYPKDIDKAISHITKHNKANEKKNDPNKSIPDDDKKYQSQTNDNEQKMEQQKQQQHINWHCESIKTCPALNRIIAAMKLYKNNHNVDDKLLEISQNYPSFLSDFHHILDEHLNEDKYGKNKSNEQFEFIYNSMIHHNELTCDVMKCSIYLRNNRERETQSIKCNDKHLHTLTEILDAIHCYFIHSVDIGYRILQQKNSQKNSQNNSNNNTQDTELKELKEYLKTKRAHLSTIRGKNRMAISKFATDAMQLDKNEQDEKKGGMHGAMSSEQEDKKIQYSFGTSFKYNNVRQKYSTMKEEIINNKIYCLSAEEFANAYEKAEFLLKNSNKIKKIRMFEKWYQSGTSTCYTDGFKDALIRGGVGLQIANVLAIILYTDYDTLSSNFSKTFRKIRENETYDEIESRNIEYFNWSKTLIITVNGYGRKVRSNSINTFYHGTSFVYMTSSVAIFNSPTSTTPKLSVAAIFAKQDGIILELNGYSSSYDGFEELRCFDCSFISNFANEDERLFIQPPRGSSIHYALEITAIRLIDTDEIYREQLRALNLMRDIFQHSLSSSSFSEKDASSLQWIIKEFIENSINNTHDTYIAKMANLIFQHQTKITIDLKKIPLYLKDYFLHDNFKNLLSIEKITNIYPEIKEIKSYDCWCSHLTLEQNLQAILMQLDTINKRSNSKLKRFAIKSIDIKWNSTERNDALASTAMAFMQRDWNMQSDWNVAFEGEYKRMFTFKKNT